MSPLPANDPATPVRAAPRCPAPAQPRMRGQLRVHSAGAIAGACAPAHAIGPCPPQDGIGPSPQRRVQHAVLRLAEELGSGVLLLSEEEERLDAELP